MIYQYGQIDLNDLSEESVHSHTYYIFLKLFIILGTHLKCILKYGFDYDFHHAVWMLFCIYDKKQTKMNARVNCVYCMCQYMPF